MVVAVAVVIAAVVVVEIAPAAAVVMVMVAMVVMVVVVGVGGGGGREQASPVIEHELVEHVVCHVVLQLGAQVSHHGLLVEGGLGVEVAPVVPFDLPLELFRKLALLHVAQNRVHSLVVHLRVGVHVADHGHHVTYQDTVEGAADDERDRGQHNLGNGCVGWRDTRS